MLNKQTNSQPSNYTISLDPNSTIDEQSGFLQNKQLCNFIEPNYLKKIRQYCSFDTQSNIEASQIPDSNEK